MKSVLKLSEDEQKRLARRLSIAEHAGSLCGVRFVTIKRTQQILTPWFAVVAAKEH